MGEEARADIVAYFERDPATTSIKPFLFYKGFHALQTHRVGLALEQGPPRHGAVPANHMSDLFTVDIHPLPKSAAASLSIMRPAS